MTNISRREFGRLAAAAGASATLSAWANAPERMIGIQVGAVSFVDEGVSAVLDRLQRDAGINTLFVAAFSYGRGIAGRQVPGQPLPDHGKQEYDTDFRGGNFARVHPQYYLETSLNSIQATDYGDFDVLGDVLQRVKGANDVELLIERYLAPIHLQQSSAWHAVLREVERRCGGADDACPYAAWRRSLLRR